MRRGRGRLRLIRHRILPASAPKCSRFGFLGLTVMTKSYAPYRDDDVFLQEHFGRDPSRRFSEDFPCTNLLRRPTCFSEFADAERVMSFCQTYSAFVAHQITVIEIREREA